MHLQLLQRLVADLRNLRRLLKKSQRPQLRTRERAWLHHLPLLVVEALRELRLRLGCPSFLLAIMKISGVGGLHKDFLFVMQVYSGVLWVNDIMAASSTLASAS
ncbi:hypothetical protein BDZ45DRAFT_328626 [Acephala macrosclerotiorum]|nr:hypothetical protein BDZ45DRAFT_328626 [Acephala macrosclerotiorum]